MASFSKLVLSGSTNGRAVQVSATASPGTIVHTGSTTTTDLDEVWLYAVNSGTADVKLTLEWGGTSAPADFIEVTVPGESGLVPIVPGLIIKGAATALIVRAFAGTASVINVVGFVNRISA
jgi:hypothetical protein